MTTLSLKDIILKKDFSFIKMGMSVNQVIEILGKPEPNNIFDDNFGTVILFYGGYEFAFFDNKLHYFQNDNIIHDWIEFENKYFKIDTWLFKNNKKILLENFINVLKKENVVYELNKIKSDGNYIQIKLFNGMRIEFNKDKILYAIRYENFEQE